VFDSLEVEAVDSDVSLFAAAAEKEGNRQQQKRK
jgi:hypothetical protein